MADRRAMQCACYSLEDKQGRLLIEVDLPEVEKKDVTAHLSEGRFHVTPRFVKG